MFIELIELLRCSSDHEESWLVAAIQRAEGRVILEGRLGCHVCGAQYPITGGVALFGPAPTLETVDSAVAAADALRVAALLGLDSASGTVVLHGNAASAADMLLEMLPVSVLALNPTISLPPRERLGVVSTAYGIPLRTGVAVGVALDRGDAPLADSVRVLRPGGRLLASVSSEVPKNVDELARDEREWVAVKTATGEAVKLTRR